VKYKIKITPTALKMLSEIRDTRVQKLIVKRIEGLENEPAKQGKALVAELSRYRSIRSVGQRYRIIYRVREERVIVYIVALGIRKEGDKKDIYTLAKKLLRLGI
jgi:mRNA interferase RelE/StbE